MSLAAHLKEAKANTKPTFEEWVDALDDDDREALIEAAKSGMASRVIAIAIRAAGGKVGHETLDAWRRTIGQAR